ncbi:hypothetical protein [Polaromonas sp. CG9_12]|nr:hypothetical protein [Polaromonas sp. CG9_12]
MPVAGPPARTRAAEEPGRQKGRALQSGRASPFFIDFFE